MKAAWLGEEMFVRRAATAVCLALWAVAAGAAEPEAPVRRRVAITIDDGPRPAFIPRALDIFDRYGVKVTFFHLGVNVKQYPALVAECAQRGHEVENHSYSHPVLSRLSADRIGSEITRTSALTEQQTGRRPTYVRPPYGAHNQRVREVIQSLGMEMALWTIDPYDWQGSATASRTASRILSHLHNDAIILIHEVPATLAALPAVLEGIRSRGYDVVTLHELLTGRPAADPRYVVIRCGEGTDDAAHLARGFAYMLERGLRVARPPQWSDNNELRFRLIVPKGSTGTLRVDLAAADANQKVTINDRAVGSFAGPQTVRVALGSEVTGKGEVVVTVSGEHGAGVRHVAFEAAR